MSDPISLVADIGGTNARFAIADTKGVSLTNERTIATNDFPGLHEAIEHYLAGTDQPAPSAICIAVAGPVVAGNAHLTNNTWQISTRALEAHFETKQVRVLNDFEAIAFALPVIGGQFSSPLGGPAYQPKHDRQCLAVLGPGTGLGASGLVHHQGHYVPLSTEAGHVGFAPETPLQAKIRDRLLTRYRRLSAERLVSGLGIENIYWALADPEQQFESITSNNVSAAEIFIRNANNTDPTATMAVAEFCRILGQVAGDLVLSLGAFDGVFIAGGVAQRHPAVLKASAFRTGFEAKGRHRSLMQDVPSMLVEHPQPGLLGALRALQQV